jgi:hypothetical protein
VIDSPWFVVVGSGYPASIVNRCNDGAAMIRSKATESFAPNASVVGGGMPEQYAERMQRETVKWSGVIKAAGIEPQ